MSSRPGALIDRRAITRLRDRLALGARRLDPRRLGFLELCQGLPRSAPEGRAEAQIRDVGNVPFVLLAIEYIDDEHTITQSVLALEQPAAWKALESFAEYGSWHEDRVTWALTRLIATAPGR